MPIIERDAWRLQYFAGIVCPDHVVIPTDDTDSYVLYPHHRWVYNKLLICETQGLAGAPHGILPPEFPVFSKPIYNLRGMGTGSRIMTGVEDYERHQAPGHMWMPYLEGEHLSTDVAVAGGRPLWWRHTRGHPLASGTFDHWTLLAEPRPTLEAAAAGWIATHLQGYTGIVNLETIAGRIIECHLRMSDQWVDLYGRGWVEAVVELYDSGVWRFDDSGRRTGYSVVLFARHGPRYAPPPQAVLDGLLAEPDISSIQITFRPGRPPDTHAMPPGGFRLAIVNCWSLTAGRAAREVLSAAIREA